jgi:hypothetical protein
LVEQDCPDLLEIGFDRQQVKILGTENLFKNGRKNIRKYIHAENEDGHIPPVFPYGRKEKRVESEKGGNQERVSDYGKNQPRV